MGIVSVGGHIILKNRSPLDVGDNQSEAAAVGGGFLHFYQACDVACGR